MHAPFHLKSPDDDHRSACCSFYAQLDLCLYFCFSSHLPVHMQNITFRL